MYTILLLLYVLNGAVTLESKVVTSAEECYTVGTKRLLELQANPSFDGGIYAGCVESKVKEVKRIGDTYVLDK